MGYHLFHTFEKIDGIISTRPHMNVRVHAIGRYAMPSHLDSYRVTVARAVLPVLIQPVQAISHEVRVEADPHLPIGGPFLPDPIKHCAEAPITAAYRIEMVW